jgi:hypothetical protein
VNNKVNINEESSPVAVNDTSQEGNSIFPEKSNESTVTEAMHTEMSNVHPIQVISHLS